MTARPDNGKSDVPGSGHSFEGFTPVIPIDRAFDARLGIEYETLNEASARATLVIRDELLNSQGVVHGGVYAAVAEGLASTATAVTVVPRGFACSGMSNETKVVGGASSGTLQALARCVHASSDIWIWHIEIAGEDGAVCALSTVTLAVRARPS